MRTGGLWSKKEQECHINNLEHLAIKLALQQNDEVQVSTYSSRQFDGPESTFENGSNKECFFFIDGSKIWRLAATIEWNEILQNEIVTQVK